MSNIKETVSSASSFWGGAGQESSTTEALNNSINSMIQSRIGEITWFPPNVNMNKKPDYLVPKGNTVAKAAYPALWNAAKNVYGLIGKVDWDAKFAATGACMAFCEISDTVFRIPYIKNNAVFRDGSQILGLPSDAKDVLSGYEDAIRNITGSWKTGDDDGSNLNSTVIGTGCIESVTDNQTMYANNTFANRYAGKYAKFDASKVVPTASENRMISVFGTPAMYTGNPALPALVPTPEWLEQLASVTSQIAGVAKTDGDKNITINNTSPNNYPILTLFQKYAGLRANKQGRINFEDGDNQNITIRHNTYDSENPAARLGKSLIIEGYGEDSGSNNKLYVDIRGALFPRNGLVFENAKADNSWTDATAKPEISWNYNSDYANIGFHSDLDTSTTDPTYMYFKTGDNGDEGFRFQNQYGPTLNTWLDFDSTCMTYTGKLFVGRGAQTAKPSITFAMGDNDSGFHWVRDGVIDFWSNGVRRFGMMDLIHAASDERIKTNIKYVDNSLEKMKAFDGVTYDRTDLEEYKDANIHEAGFIAQKVKSVFPEAVEIREQNGYSDFHAINYSRITVLHHNAINELNKKHDTEMFKLKHELSEIKALVNQLIGDKK